MCPQKDIVHPLLLPDYSNYLELWKKEKVHEKKVKHKIPGRAGVVVSTLILTLACSDNI